MSGRCLCLGEHLEAYALGKLSGDESEAVFAHLRQCESCTREVAWLRTERRILSERAARNDAPALKLAALRRDVLKAVPAAKARTQRREFRARAFDAGRALLSAAAAVTLAFVLASFPQGGSGREPVRLAMLSDADCMSSELADFCGPPTAPHERVAAVEDAYDACLLQTPRSGPGAGDSFCW